MDQSLLVRSGHALIDLLEANGITPSAAMWVKGSDVDIWKFWVVLHDGNIDKRDFYRRVSELISKNSINFQDIDASYIELIPSNHPAVQALSKMFRISGKSDIHVQSNMLNGFYLPDGIILRMDIPLVKKVG